MHGRWSEYVHANAPFIEDQKWKRIVDGFDRLGYGYSDYAAGTGHEYISGSYGVSLVKPHITVRDIEGIPGTRIHLYRERGWGDNHDLVVFGRPAFDEPWEGMAPELFAQVREGRRYRRDPGGLGHAAAHPHHSVESRSAEPADHEIQVTQNGFAEPILRSPDAAFDPPGARLIAFHLPQFHPILENDQWWGKGFTEWTNVARAKPLFRGHYQPRLPADLGYYDLQGAETRQAQAELATAYGIEGFCYWHYWFHGIRLLERPVDEILASGEPDFPFCLAWANESWSRSWLGDKREVLIEQKYSEQDDRVHARWLAKAFADPRYIHVNGRPLLVVYKPMDLPEAKRTTEIFRDECRRLGQPEPYLVGIDAHCPGTDMRSARFRHDRAPRAAARRSRP